MKQKSEGKFKSKRALIIFMEFIIAIGCLIALFAIVTPKERITETSYSYSRPEEVSKYVVVNEYITRIRPQTEYETFKTIAEKTLDSKIKVYSDAEKTKEITEGYISTGMIVESEEGEDYKANVIGDMTKNGDCNVAELTQIIRQIVGLSNLNEEQKLSADFSGDNIINITDVSMCINYIVYGEMKADEVTSLEKPEIKITGDGNGTWYKSNVEVKIISNDTNAKNTNTTIESKIEGQESTSETTQELQIQLTKDGNYKISSQNVGENNIKSEIETKAINIDKILPEIEIQKTLNNNKYEVNINASDNNGIVKYKKQKNNEQEQVVNIDNQKEIEDSIVISENGNYKFEVEDIAGNIVTKEVEITDIKNSYTIRFLNDDETEISSKEYTEGQEIEIPENPTKQEDDTYTYEFSRWDKEVEKTATKNIDYIAVYNKTSKDYTITFLNEDGTEIIAEKTFKSTDKVVEEPQVPEKEGYIGYWEEYTLKAENIKVKAYYVEELENGTVLKATDSNGITWEYTYHDGKAISVRYDEGELGTTVEIPSRLNGYPVEEIKNNNGGNIFSKDLWDGNEKIENVIIPSSLKTIGAGAFRDCDKIEKLEIPESVTTINRDAFEAMSNLKEVKIPSSVTEFGSNIFSWCQNLEKVEIGEGIKKISYGIFSECYALKNVNLPSSIEIIEDRAFSNCNNLTNIDIGDNVNQIGGLAFSGCGNLENINVSKNNETYASEDGVLYNKTKTELIKYLEGNKDETYKIKIRNSVQKIGNYAFSGCYNLKNIEIGNNVTEIGNYAFSSCRSLSEIEIPDSVTSIGEWTFSHCRNLKNIKLPNSITTINRYTFYGCGLISIEIPNSVTRIKTNAFDSCENISTITIPSSVTNMESFIFESCRNLSDIYVDKLKSETEGFSGSWKGYSCNAFIHYKDCKHTITTEIEDDNVNVLSISNNLEDGKINCKEDYKFKLVDNNNEVITDKIVMIGSQEIYGNYYEVMLESDENNIYTIKNVNRNKTIKVKEQDYIQNGVKLLSTDENGITWQYTYKDGKAEDVHYRFGNLGEIVDIPSKLSGYEVKSLYNKSERNIFVNEDNRNNETIVQVNIPEGIELIGEYAFYYCNSLSKINISSSVKTIEYKAFNGCNKLEQLDIPDGVIEIEDRAFSECQNLKNISIPSSVAKIGDDVFSGCYSISNIYVDNEKENIDLGYGWNPYGYTHFKDCKHEITFEKHTNIYSEVQEVSNNRIDNNVNCLDTYQFKLLNKKGRVITSEKVLVKFEGVNKEEQDYERIRKVVDNGGDLFADEEEGIIEIKPNDEGIYTIENIHRDIKIIIQQYESTDKNGITWNYSYEEGFATNVYYTSGNLGETVEIPEKLDGYPVIGLSNKQNAGSIFQNAGENKETIKTIILPNSITEIGNYAFHKLTNVENIEVPDSLTTIGYAAFYGCENLKEIEIPNTVTTIKGWAFAGCANLKNIMVPSTVIDMGEAVFNRCSNLDSIELLSNIDKVEKYTFMDCSKLINITLSNTITTIEESAFAGCGGLVNLNIPSNITKIKQNAFGGCSNLKDINIPDSVTEIGDDAFSYCSSLEEINIPSSVRTLGAIFNSCYNLKNVYIDNLKEDVTITTYNGYLWGYGPNTYIHFKDSKYSINSKIYSKVNLTVEPTTDIGRDGKVLLNDTYKFRILDNEENIITNEDVKIVKLGLTKEYSEEIDIYPDENGIYTIENINRNIMIVVGGKYSNATDENGITWKYTYEEGKATNVHYMSGELGENLVIPDTLDGYPVVSLYKERDNDSNYNIFGKKEYESFSTIKNISMPDSVITIGDYAFSGCDNLESIELSQNLETMGIFAFSNCSSLEEINIPNQVQEIGNCCFYNCYNIQKITLPENLKEIKEGTFSYCNQLNDINIPESIEKIGYGSFASCGSLSNITLPEGIKTIDNSAFGYCNNLEEINFPNSLQKICENAFRDCNKLNNIEISDNLLDIGCEAFCNTGYYNNQSEGVWYVGKVAMGYKGDMPKKTNVVIKDGTKAIADKAFNYKEELKSIELPDSIVRIGNGTFIQCNLLESIELPRNIEYIGEGAFSDCTKLKTIVIWDSIAGVGRNAFRGWRKDQEIDIQLQEISESWDKDWKEDCDAKIVFAYTGE